MKFIGSTKLHRKSGFWGTRLGCSAQDFHVGPRFMLLVVGEAGGRLIRNKFSVKPHGWAR
jgi:hypothetical protein